MKNKRISIGTWVLWALTSAGTALALEPTGADPAAEGRRPHGPPPEAVDACASASAGDTCSFEHDGHSIDGTCRNGPNGDQPLACMPAHPPRPPQAAFSACEGRSAGDICKFVLDERSFDGICRSGPHGDEPLACLPNPPE
jgi:hypothetical protein